MNKTYIWIIIIIALAIAYKVLDEKKVQKINYREAYEARRLLTSHELQEYIKLKQLTDERSWIICPKVRLLDLIEPKKKFNRSERQNLKNKVWSKHVDFVLLDQKMQLIGVLELDDNTHDREDRKERDSFVREALEGAGIIMVQTRSITLETLDKFSQEKRD